MSLRPPQGSPNVGAMAVRALRRYPDRVAFSWDGGELTYAAAAELIGRMQAAYAGVGARCGDRVALLSGNRAEAWCAAVAAQLSGMAITWLHPLGSREDQLHQIEEVEARLTLVDGFRYEERGTELSDALPSGAVLSLGRSGVGRDFLAMADRTGAAPPRLEPGFGDLAAILYTGGTTGRPKGVLRSHLDLVAGWLISVLANFELPRAPRYLAVGPISHVTGTKILPSLTLGGTVHLMNETAPDRILSAIERQRISFALMVPTMIYGLLDAPELERSDLSSLELLIYGASPISAARLEEALERIGPVLGQLYGQTECYPISVLSRYDQRERLGSCGQPVTGLEVNLQRGDGEPVEEGEVGEICVRGPHVSDGYWKQPQPTVEALAGGWLHTGDLARCDEHGYLYIVDRTKDMIISGGFNVYAREVEDALTAHPAVSAAAVFGVPDERWDEAVTAAVVLRPGADLAEAELISHVKELKGSVQAPKSIRFLAELPLTSVGKVDKRSLRETLLDPAR